MKRRIKIYGMPRTGTTWVYETIKHNFPNAEPLGEEYGSKHFAPRQAARDDLYYAICIKHPIPWVVSILRLSKHKGVVEKFCGRTVEDWIDRYNYRYRLWLTLPMERTAVVCHELAMEGNNLFDCLYPIAGQYDGKVITEACGWHVDNWDPEYYRQGKYFDELNTQQIEAIVDNVDHQLLRDYGYE